MKNDKAKPMRVVLLDGAGKPIVINGGYIWRTCDHGVAGFRVMGRQTVFQWSDDGKTWKRAEAEK